MSSIITTEEFKTAIEALPFVALIEKAKEMRNSVQHLRSSNDQLREFRSDPDCVEAIEHNEGVMGRILVRAELLQAELLRRPNGMHLPEDVVALNELLKEQVQKDVEREIAELEKLMREKYGDEFVGTARPEATEGRISTTTTEDPSHTSAAVAERQSTRAENGGGTHEDLMGVHGNISTAAATSGSQAEGNSSGRHTDADLARLLDERMREMDISVLAADEGEGIIL